jgi:hypothetical protein
MALFDGIFDNNSMPTSGGLLARLAALAGNAPSQVGMMPSDVAQYGTAPTAPLPIPQAAPMAPQMPVAQSPQLPPQQPVTVPQQPAQNPLQSYLQASQPASLFSPSPNPNGVSLGDRLQAGLINATHGGGLLTGLITGLATGQRTDPQGIAQQKMQAQYQALVPVLGPQKALIAVINPDVGKALLQDALVNKDKYSVVTTGKDAMGAETKKVFNSTTGTFQDIPKTAADTAAAANSGLGNMNLTGQDYLASLPQNVRGTVQGMIEGTLPPPTSFALGKPYWQNLIAAAKNVDPTFDAANWSGRVAGVKDFSAGKSSEMVRSANQVLGHLSTLVDKADALHNGSYPLLNYAENGISTALGGAATTGFSQAANAVADELAKVYKGAGISDREIQEWKQNLSPNMSPAQLHEAISTASELLNHALSALEEKRLSAIGPVAAAKAGPLLKPDAQAALEKIQKWASGKAAEAAAAPSTTKTGVQWSVQ